VSLLPQAELAHSGVQVLFVRFKKALFDLSRLPPFGGAYSRVIWLQYGRLSAVLISNWRRGIKLNALARAFKNKNKERLLMRITPKGGAIKNKKIRRSLESASALRMRGSKPLG
jgi:hypothetical protein